LLSFHLRNSFRTRHIGDATDLPLSLRVHSPPVGVCFEASALHRVAIKARRPYEGGSMPRASGDPVL
jgi:hypothetical protein